MKQTTTQPVKKSNKEVKVLAINTLYEYAALFYNYEKEHFTKFIGTDIFKVDGSVKQKYDHEKMSYKGQLQDGTWVNAHYWFTSNYGSFNINIKICVNGGSYDVKPTTAFCQYEEMTLTLFNIEDSKLVATNTDISHLKTRYDLSDLVKIADEIEQAKKEYERAYNKMPHRFNEVFYIGRITTN